MGGKLTIRLSPGLAEFYIERGHAYTVSGKAEAAIQDLTAALRLNPSSARAFRLNSELGC